MAHSYTNLLYHIVYATVDRQPLIDDSLQPRLYDYLGGTIRGLKGVCLEIGGVQDHVHILAKLHPTISVSDFLEIKLLEMGQDNQARVWLAGRICGFHRE